VATAEQRPAANEAFPRAARTWLQAHAGALRRAALSLAVLAQACGPQEPAPPAAASADGWHEFSGSWTAAGRRKLLQLGPQRRVAVVDVSGSLLLGGPTRPAVGFHGEAITFADDLTGMLGRAVWTDEHGDQAFSELAGRRDGERLLITGTFVGGSGRYAGATGEYAFEWHYMIESDDGRVQGRTQGLAGRVRMDSADGPPAEPPR
jgi:hypothetical protein